MAYDNNFALNECGSVDTQEPSVPVSVEAICLNIGGVRVYAVNPRIEDGKLTWDFDTRSKDVDLRIPKLLPELTKALLTQWVKYQVDPELSPDTGVSDIYERLHSARIPHFGNDNISEVLHDGDLDRIEASVTKSMYRVLRDLVIDVDADHNMRETARRHAKMLVRETFAGRYQRKPAVTVFPNVKKVDELIVVGPIVINSACSHHLVPITGEAFLGILPGATSALPGLSKYERIAQWVAQRPQIQEEMAAQIADEIEKMTNCDGLALVIRAKHMCCSIRGVKNPNSMMRSSVMRGVFRTNPSAKAEFLSIIAGQ